ncbi:MAG: hypothetical protein KGL53_05725, partial [Elusimicrobia bacterium]|nr:hypothetical protein [Elusimicrobiota bacterium]
GVPAAMGDSLGLVRGRANHIGRDFKELRAAFGFKGDAGVSPVASVAGSLRGTAAGADASFVDEYVYRPLRAARTGLARLIDAGRESSASQAPPVPLTLSTSQHGLKLALNGVSEKAESAKPRGGLFSLGRAAVSFIGSLVVAQVGVEALGAAMPTLVQKTFGDFTVVAQLAVFSSIASIIGLQVGPALVRRFGLKKAYLGASVIRLVSISALAGLLATGHMTLPLMMGFYSLNGALSGVSQTAMVSIPPAIVGSDQGRLEKFWTWEQTILETIGITAPIATGAVVAHFGFLPALVAFPVTMAASLGIVLMTLKLPSAPAAAAPTDAPKHGFWAKVFGGARMVWGSPLLRTSFLGFTVFMMLNPFLYTMLAPAYGLALLGASHAQAATGIIGWLTGLYSAGGLLGGLMMMWEQRRTRAESEARRSEYAAKNGSVSDKEWEELSKPWRDALLKKSLLKWMLLGTFGLAALPTMAFALPILPFNLTVPALALVPFGVAQVVSVLKLRSFFQANVPDPDKNMADAMGFFGAGSLAVSTAGLMTLKFLFQHFTGFAPFTYVGLAMLPLAGYYLYLRWRLGRLSKPS